MEVRDALHQLGGIEILELFVEPAEGLSGHAQHLRVPAGGLKAGGAFDVVVHAPELHALVLKVHIVARRDAVFQHKIILSLRGMAEVQPPPLFHRPLAGADVFRDALDVAHHADGFPEHIGVDLLDEKLGHFLPVVDRDIVGRVDVSRGDPAVDQDVPVDPELSADAGQLLFACRLFVHVLPYPDSSSFFTSACSAAARWLMAFLASGSSSAVVRPSSGTRNSGS